MPSHSSSSPLPTIEINAQFSSFDEFHSTLNAWMAANYQPFRVASSEMLKDINGEMNSTFRYRYIVYHCMHYGEPRKRGVGKRPKQSYMSCGCTAAIRVNYSYNEQRLKITTIKLDHINHQISPEAFEDDMGKSKSKTGATPNPKRKCPRRAVSASSTGDSEVSTSPEGMMKEEKDSSSFSSTSHSTNETTMSAQATGPVAPYVDSTADDDEYIDPGINEQWKPTPSADLPAPVPQYPPSSFVPLMMQPYLFMGNMIPYNYPLYNFTPQFPSETPMGSSNGCFAPPYNQVPTLLPVQPSPEEKENCQIKTEGSSSPQEFTTLQPMKATINQEFPPNIQQTISGLQQQLMGGDPIQAASRQAELQSLISKWGSN